VKSLGIVKQVVVSRHGTNEFETHEHAPLEKLGQSAIKPLLVKRAAAITEIVTETLAFDRFEL
jgi:hypothetical protein